MIEVTAINAFNDNYIWLITNPNSQQCYLVDPGDAAVCINKIEELQLSLAGLLITHHHWDHTNGIAELHKYAQSKGTSLIVWGPVSDKIEGITHTVAEGDEITLFDHDIFSVLDVPGHTLDHIAYLNHDCIFCGDTLFSAGCGRMFEGTPKQMSESLSKLKALDNRVKVYCAHEYTLANLAFAQAVEPKNSSLLNYLESVKSQRANGLSTIPTNIGIEKQVNPFLRTDEAAVKATLTEQFGGSYTTNAETFAQLRAWKDKF